MGVGRPKKQVKQDNLLAVYVEDSMLSWLDDVAEQQRVSRSNVIREILYNAKRDYCENSKDRSR